MKRFLPILSLAFLAAACNPSTDLGKDTAGVVQQEINPDTIGLAKYQEWKSQNEMADIAEFNKPVEIAAAAPVAKTQVARKVQRTPVRKAPVATRKPSSSTTNSSSNSGSTASSGAGNTSDAGSGTVAQAPEKKGMSKAAKGAIIGGAGGAIAGAVINKKNRAAGAIIGATVGAAGGYVIGRKMDKKDEGSAPSAPYVIQ